MNKTNLTELAAFFPVARTKQQPQVVYATREGETQAQAKARGDRIRAAIAKSKEATK